MSRLYPEGVDHLVDLPWTWVHAVKLAQVYISFDELPKDERPPKRIWDSTEALEAHFRWVEEERKRKYGGGGGSSEPSEPPKQNDAVRSLVSG